MLILPSISLIARILYNLTMNSSVIYQNKYFNVSEDRFTRPNGHKGLWYTVHRQPAEVVVILPITRDNHVLFIKQRRVPLNDEYCLELPAGICDVQDETLEELAARELREETGYNSSNIEWVMKGAVSPGILDEIAHLFIAIDCDLDSSVMTKDPSEQIEVIKIPVNQAWDYYSAQALSGLVDCKVGTALVFGLKQLGLL